MSDKKEGKPGKEKPDYDNFPNFNPFAPKKIIILPPGVNLEEDEKPKKYDGVCG